MAAKHKTSDVEIYSAVMKDGRTTTWVVRERDGKVTRLRVSKASSAQIEQIAKKYAGAMKRLATR